MQGVGNAPIATGRCHRGSGRHRSTGVSSQLQQTITMGTGDAQHLQVIWFGGCWQISHSWKMLKDLENL